MEIERTQEEADIYDCVEKEWGRERKVAVVSPFFHKFEQLLQTEKSEENYEYLTYLKNRVRDKFSADKAERERKCHKGVLVTWQQHKKKFLDTASVNIVRLLNSQIKRGDEKRCTQCGGRKFVNTCHCHHYYCKKCYADRFCRECRNIIAYPEEIFQFQSFVLSIKHCV